MDKEYKGGHKMARRKQNRCCRKVVMVITLLGMFGCGSVVGVDAKTIATLTRDGTTFTGSNVYTVAGGPAGYYTLSIKSGGVVSRFLFENITLKSTSGVQRPVISASGSNTSNVSTSTTVFADGYYSMNGYYYYSVTTNKGNNYVFSATY